MVVPGLIGVVSVSAGGQHVVAVKSDGTVMAWGYNEYGQLGDGTTVPRHSPVAVPGLTGVVAVSAGSSHSVALKTDGTVVAWGDNSTGQLGDGTQIGHLSPVVVSGLTGVVAVKAGVGNTAVLKSDGTVWTWGASPNGQLGGVSGTQVVNNSWPFRLNPGIVPGLAGVAALSVGGGSSTLAGHYGVQTTVVLKTDGTLMAWGQNQGGQLGNGTATMNSSFMSNPVPVAVHGLSGVVALSDGLSLAMALKSDGTVWVWGPYGKGFGDGVVTPRLTPVAVPGLAGVVSVSASLTHALALKADGTVMAWGDNSFDELGEINTQYWPFYVPKAVPWFSGNIIQTIGAISFTPTTLTLGGTTTASATATSGLPVSFTYLGQSPGNCSVSGSTVTGVTVGSCTIIANQAGDATYHTATQVTQSIIVSKASQTISFGAAPAIIVSGTGRVSATATSGLAVTLTSTTPSVCTVSGTTVTDRTAGTCTIAANQAGNTNYYAATQVTQSIAIGDPDAKDPSNNPKTNSSTAGTNKNALGFCPAPSSASRDPVDLATGYYYDTLSLMEVAAAGAPLQMNLSYNSGNPAQGSVGFGWGNPYQYRLADFTTSVKITWPDSHVSIYIANGAGGYSNAAADAADTLVKNVDGTYTLTDRRQKTYQFDASGKLISTTDRMGFVKHFTYLVGGNLDRVTDALSGRYLQFAYDAQSRLSSVTSAGVGTVALAYDANGDLASVTDALGNATSFTYDANHRLLTKVNAMGATTVANTYDAVTGRVVSQDDGLTITPLEQFTYATNAVTYLNRTGGSTRYNFDTGFNLLSSVDPLGGTETHGYAATGVQTAYKDPLNNQTSFTHDSAGYVLTRTDVQGNVASYSYDADHNITSSTDEAGNVTTMTYAPPHQLLSKTDAAGGVTTYTYNAQGLLASVTAPKGGVTTYTYDAQGQLSSQVDPAGLTTGYTYDAAGRMLTRTDGAGNVWTWTYDLLGQVLSVADPLGNTTRYSYDALGRVATKTAPGGGITRFTYDIHDNLTSLTDALGNVSTFAYDADDQLSSSTDALGHVTTVTRDAKGRVTSVTDALGNITGSSYNAADDVTATRDALNNQHNFAYDELRRLTAVTGPLNTDTTLAYDTVSRMTRRTDAKGGATSFGYDALGQMVSASNALGGIAAQAFDPNGNRVSFTDANGNATTFTLDAADRITRIATADGGAISYTYNIQNRIATATNGRGQVATYSYNTAGQLITLADPAGTTTFTYDADGNILTVGDAVGTSSYTYDLLNRISGYTDVFGNAIAYAYDAVGNLATLTYPGNKTVTYAYDAANRMVSATDWSGHVTAYTYDARGNLTAVARANGTRGTYSYDARGQITAIAETAPGSASLYGIAYTYDANGNITSELTTPAVTPPALATTSMTYGTDNRLATANGQAVAYDADGNMTGGPLNGATSAYSFDARSRLTGVGSSSYVYDAQGNRISATNAGITTRYVVDPNAALPRVLMETDAAGTPIAWYVYGPSGLISRESATGAYHTYHYDLRGSTLKLADTAGAVTDSYRYGPYGELLATTGTTSNPFRYNGRDGVMTEANGLYFMRARYYLPEAKRFVNRDTLLGSVTQTLTLNRFAYVNGNPLGFVDPSGMTPLGNRLVAGGVGLALFGPETYLVAAGMVGVGLAINHQDQLLGFLSGAFNTLINVSNASDDDVSSKQYMTINSELNGWGASSIRQPSQGQNALVTRRPEGCHSKDCIIREWVTGPSEDVGLISIMKGKLRQKVNEQMDGEGICPGGRSGSSGVRG